MKNSYVTFSDYGVNCETYLPNTFHIYNSLRITETYNVGKEKATKPML